LEGILGQIIRPLLQGPRTVDELLDDSAAERRRDVLALLEDLVQRGILTDVRRSPCEQYLRYTFTGDSTLAEYSVTVLGAGPLGARLARGLVQHGIGRLTLLDERQTDNLWHTFLPFSSTASRESSRPAHIALAENLQDAGYAGIQPLEGELDAAGVERAVMASDFTVVAFERPFLRLSHLTNRFAIRQRKPWMQVTTDGNLGLVGPLFLPTYTACYNDYRALADAATPNAEMAHKYRHYLLERGSGGFFLGLPAYVDILAGYAALATVHFLLRGTCFALGRVLTLNFDRMLVDVEDVLRLPRCPVCGTDKSAMRPPFPPNIVQDT
jgi:bacteriocin biosynthesis cyclodehydratase domain-containing protein